MARVIFTSSGTYTPPAGVTTVDVVLVGGGGGGGRAGSSGAGGSGGQVRHVTGVAVTPGVPVTVTVGAGGAGRSGSTGAGADGQPSAFGALTALGGGAGAGGGSSTPGQGAYGGGGQAASSGSRAGGVGLVAFRGGNGVNNYESSVTRAGAGGGGGAAGNGGDASSDSPGGAHGNVVAGNGGPGVDLSAIVGTDVGDSGRFGGGGGGGTQRDAAVAGTGGAGGVGGGGAGRDDGTAIPGGAGAPNTGGGGGGGSGSNMTGQATDGGDGGSGIVIVLEGEPAPEPDEWPATIAGSSTGALTTPAGRWAKPPMTPVWRSPADGQWHAAVPTASGHRDYALTMSGPPVAGAVLESSQARRVAVSTFDGGKVAVLRYGATTVCDVYDATGTKIVDAAPVPLTPSDTDASPVALLAVSETVLLASAWYGGIIRTARSADGGATWSSAASVSVSGSTTGAVVLLRVTSTFVTMIATGNDGVGGVLVRRTNSAVLSWFSTDTLPALPAGTTSDDHVTGVILPGSGYPCVVVKTTNANTNLPLFVQYVRESTAATAATWVQHVIETSPDDVPGYTRPRMTVVGDEVWLVYGAFGAGAQDLYVRRAPVTAPTAWSARETLHAGPDYSDGAVLPLQRDVDDGPLPWLAHERATGTVLLGWIGDAPTPQPATVAAPAAVAAVDTPAPSPAGRSAGRVSAPDASAAVTAPAPTVRGSTAAVVAAPAASATVAAPRPSVTGRRAARVEPPPAPAAAATQPPSARGARRARAAATAARAQVVAYAPRVGGGAATVVVVPAAAATAAAGAPAVLGRRAGTVRPPATRILAAAPRPVAAGRRAAAVRPIAAAATARAGRPFVGRPPGPTLPDVLTLTVLPAPATLTVLAAPATLTVHPAPATLEVMP